MDTVMTMRLYGGSEELIKSLEGRIKELEGLFSVTDTGSEIYELNHTGSAELSDDTIDLVTRGLELSEATGGALDLTVYPIVRAWGFTTGEYRVPDEDELRELLQKCDHEKINISGSTASIGEGMELDLGAVAKGYTADVLTAMVKEAGVKSALLDLGGNISLIGEKPGGGSWGVGVRDPFSEENIGVLRLVDCMAVTSGSYERNFEQNGKVYHHIIDPDSGMPADSGLASVTIIGEEGTLCDGLSTALFVMGLEDGLDLWRRMDDFEAVFVTDEGEIFITEGLEGSFESEHSYEVCRR
ncbi:MAG: FAD:protein FMN transferase [Clostridia bacterium]|nr:FAD:protein FMN transferase [Clostridia bacterium]